MTKLKAKLEGGFRTEMEKMIGQRLETVFTESKDPLENRLENFSKYVKRQSVTRFIAQYEIFKKILGIKGSIVECGVYRGGSLMTWAQLSTVLEPVNLTRRIYGFDTFEGFQKLSPKDTTPHASPKKGSLKSDSYEELKELIKIYNDNRFLGHIKKVELIKGDATKTIPKFIKENKHLVVSLLFLDFDLYEPTKTALEYFVPRMPKGSIIAFDELDNPIWPGETTALQETIGINGLKIERMEFDPYIGYAIL